MFKLKINVLLIYLVAFALSFQQVEAGIEDEINTINPQQLSSVLVQQHQEVLFEEYYNGATSQQLHDIRSASKSLTSLLFGIASKEGYFTSPYEKVLPVFKDYNPLLFKSYQKSEMTFFDLLSMTNPLECNDMNEYSRGHEERMYLTHDWIEFFLNLPARGHMPWEPKPSDLPYGRSFAYCTAGISITAAAIERRTGKKMDEYAQEKLFDSLGISNVEWLYSPTGITQGGGGLKIKPKDLLKIGQLMLNNGQWKDEQLLPLDWVTKSFTPYSVSMPEIDASYGLTWWIIPFKTSDKVVTTYAAAGNGGNYLFVVPELDATVVITATAYNTPYMHKQTHDIFSKAVLPYLLH